MKSFLFLITSVSLASCSFVGSSDSDLIKMELDRSQAIQFHDSVTLARMYADDFSGLTASGMAVNKPTLMGIFSRHGDGWIFINDDHKVRFIDKRTAVLTGRLTAKDRSDHIVSVSRYSHVLNFKDGRWQIIYGQGTVIPLAE